MEAFLIVGAVLLGFMVPELCLILGNASKIRVPTGQNFICAAAFGCIATYIAF